MITAELWKPRRAKRAHVHQMRPRRACLGELVQIDGSPYDWFEGRAPACSLLVFIDDSTGRLLELYFTPQESFFSYCAALPRRFFARHTVKPSTERPVTNALGRKTGSVCALHFAASRWHSTATSMASFASTPSTLSPAPV